jgi:hypothetical protein
VNGAAAASDAALTTASPEIKWTNGFQWFQDLRKVLSEYHSVLVSYQPSDNRKVSEFGTQLDLMLNLDEEERRALWDVAEIVGSARPDWTFSLFRPCFQRRWYWRCNPLVCEPSPFTIRPLTRWIVESRSSMLPTRAIGQKKAPGFEEPSQRIGWRERLWSN